MKTKLRLRGKVYKQLVHEFTTTEIYFTDQFDNYFAISILGCSKI